MELRKRHKIGMTVILAFLAFSVITFSNSLTPYVTLAGAKATKGTVQVRGTIVEEKVSTTADGKKLTFRLRDETGQEEVVLYAGAKPEGLERAESIVAIGRYQDNQLIAEKLLVKCPSKYQGSVKN